MAFVGVGTLVTPRSKDEADGWTQAGDLYDNAIEALNSKLLRAVRVRGHFPTDEAALKLPFLVLNLTEKEWTNPPREWRMVKAQLAILSGERFNRAAA